MKLSDLNSQKVSSYIFGVIGVIFLIIIISDQLANRPTAYSQALAKQREQKDLQFKNDPNGPIPLEKKSEFEGLAYFPVNDEYKLDAAFVPNTQPDTLKLMTTTGEIREMVDAGKLRFQLHGLSHELIAYRYLDPTQSDFFVPFKDLTSGVATYGGGRYLDIPSTEPITIDFNQAYNPYCVYNESFSCPLPPRENTLTVEVRAGEVKFDWPIQLPRDTVSLRSSYHTL
ncbi:MAG: DUF1684 domain-containing protein [Bacteroidota bacterium]